MALGVIPSAHAVDLVTLGNDLSAFTTTGLHDLVQFGGIALDHRPMAPASKMSGLLIPGGLHVGADLAMTGVPTSVSTILALVAPGTAAPTSLPVIHLSFRKGIGPVSIGFSYFSLSGLLSVYGGDAQWSLLSVPMGPSIAVRGGFSTANLWFLNTLTFSGDALASFSLANFLEPYVGLGFQTGTGSITIPAAGVLPVGVTASSTFFAPRLTVGMQINLFIAKVIPEFSYSTAGISTYGARFVLSL